MAASNRKGGRLGAPETLFQAKRAILTSSVDWQGSAENFQSIAAATLRRTVQSCALYVAGPSSKFRNG
jgi:hypothetical protein